MRLKWILPEDSRSPHGGRGLKLLRGRQHPRPSGRSPHGGRGLKHRGPTHGRVPQRRSPHGGRGLKQSLRGRRRAAPRRVFDRRRYRPRGHGERAGPRRPVIGDRAAGRPRALLRRHHFSRDRGDLLPGGRPADRGGPGAGPGDGRHGRDGQGRGPPSARPSNSPASGSATCR